MRYHRNFFFSVLIKLAVFSLILTSLVLLVEGDRFRWFYIIQAFPYVVSFVVCNQYFLGLLIIQFFLSTINLKLNGMISRYDSDFGLVQRNLDRISNIHSTLFKLTNDLESLFGYQLMFSVFNNFLVLLITAFQLFSTSLLIVLGYKLPFDTNKVLPLAAFTMLLIVIDIVFHTSIVSVHQSEVRSTNNLYKVLLSQ